MKVSALAILCAYALAGELRADPVILAYFNSGDAASLSDAIGTDYTAIDVSFLLPNPADPTQLGYDAIATTMYGDTISTGIAQSIRALQANGKKVLLSFGGSTVTSAQYAELDQNIPALAANLAQFIKQPTAADGLPLHFDGIDLDFEDTASFENPSSAGYNGVNFLINLTNDLRISTNLPSNAGWLLTQAPQPPYLSSDPSSSGNGIGGYIPVLNAVASQIDWIDMQYYNNTGFESPAQVIQNYQDIVSGWSGVPGVPDFNGLPAQKLVVGKPIAAGDAGSGWLPASTVASQIVGPLSAEYGSNFGGVFGWQLGSDPHGTWAATMQSALTPVPEPSVPALLGIAGLFGVAACARKRQA